MKKVGCVITLLLMLFCGVSASEQQSEMLKSREALIAKIDSCNKNLLKIDDKQKQIILKMAVFGNEYKTTADFFSKKGLFGEECYVLMNEQMYLNNLDSVYYYYKKGENYCNNNSPENARIKTMLQGKFITWCAVSNYAELVINHLKQYIEYNSTNNQSVDLWVYVMLILTYQSIGDNEKAIETGKVALMQPADNQLSLEYKATIAIAIGECYFALGDYQNVLAFTDSIYKYAEKIPNKHDLNLGTNFHNLVLADYYSLKSQGLSCIGKLDQVPSIFEKLESIYSQTEILGQQNSGKDILRDQIDWVKAIYYYNKGDYAQAMAYLNKYKGAKLESKLYAASRDVHQWESLILEKMGKYKEANEALRIQIHLKDSINRVNTTREASSLWAVFEVDKAQQEKAQSDFKVKIIAASTGSVILIACLLIFYFVITNNKLKDKNKVLFKQQKDLQSATSISVSLEDESVNQQVSNTYQNKKKIQSTDQHIYEQIIEYLLRTKEYTNPDISRESLAKELGTNRQYIIDAISNNAQMSFNEFINDFRVYYARDLLLSDENLMIKKIYMDAGFNSRSAFAIVFKEKFGMTPSEFRECAKVE